jgi:hypothetical protein
VKGRIGNYFSNSWAAPKQKCIERTFNELLSTTRRWERLLVTQPEERGRGLLAIEAFESFGCAVRRTRSKIAECDLQLEIGPT